MNSDWIKMRTDIYRDPRVCVMADHMMRTTNPDPKCNASRNVMRNATCGALVTLWGVARNRGERVGDDLVLKNCPLSVVDDITDMPGFGSALESVGWVSMDGVNLLLPKFFAKHNVDPYEASRAKNAERQRRFRDRKIGENSNVTVTSRNALEKSREENGLERAREWPSIEKVQGYAATIGLAPWKAEDWWNEMESIGWKDYQNRDVQNWQRLLDRVRTKWEADGRPSAPPSRQQPNGRNHKNQLPRKRVQL